MRRITDVTVFIVAGDQEEGLAAICVDGVWHPLVSCYDHNLESLRETAQDLADQSGVAVTEVTFTVREDVNQFTPRSMN